MQITEIYKKYKIMPMLQDHMFRVAGVAVIICDHIAADIDKEAVITTCLLHDTGNIVKFDLTARQDSLEPEGLDYWLNIQNYFRRKYGNDEHFATYEIAKEIGVSEKVMDLISRIGFGKSEANYNAKDFEIKICAYADSRVGFDGIVSLRERHMGSRKRYELNKKVKSIDDEFQKLYEFSKKIETQIFEKCYIAPESINDVTVAVEIQVLKKYNL